MPFVSKKQRAFAFANKPKLEAQGWNVDEWARETRGKHLPKVALKKPSAKKKKISGYMRMSKP